MGLAFVIKRFYTVTYILFIIRRAVMYDRASTSYDRYDLPTSHIMYLPKIGEIVIEKIINTTVKYTRV